MAKKTEPADAVAEVSSLLAAEPFAKDTHRIVATGGGAIGQVVYEPGHVLAEIRLATGLTLAQLCAAIRHDKAGPKS